MKKSKAIKEAFYDLSINLAAGWFASVFVLSVFAPPKSLPNLVLLTINLFLGSIFTAIAILLKQSK